ncbi:MAG TPA: VWA domain-containing protein [Actinomycetota bacterium]|nr:VWA domain-containing protein [Actinomycetota bacterium]
MPDFHLECFQNEYLAEGAREVNAVVTITASGGGTAGTDGAGDASGGGSVEVIVIDTSGSMGGAKIRAAREATGAAVAAIKDGVRFAVISGDNTAHVLYPPNGGLATASTQTRFEAQRATDRLQASGGTAIGSWLSLITSIVQSEPGIKHVILLTDGKDEHESPETLQAAIEGAKGIFQCDCRGVGTDWVVSELRKIATGLLGTVDIVADPAGLAADFEAMMTQAMGKSLADVNIRLWTPQGASISFVKQVAPDLLDLTDRRVTLNPLSGDYPTGAWGDESRDYHFAVAVNPGNVGDEMLAARVSLVVNGQVAGQALVKAVWTDDTALSTKINRQVAHYTGQAELADAIAEGLEARKQGDMETATTKLGRAVQLAAQSGNTDTAKLLAKVVDVEDPVTGKVRMKSKVDDADEMTLDTRSTKTVRVAR